jgi:hypothetical protein
MAAALVISTFSALKFASFAQELGPCAHAELHETNTKRMFLKNFVCISLNFFNQTTIPAA